jgi:hypothetical protein
MSFVAVAVIGSLVIQAGSAYMQSESAKDAADAQVEAAKKSGDTQLEMYYQTRADQAPWLEAGSEAVNTLSQKVKAGPGEYQKSPYYNFLMEQGTTALERGAAAKGKQFSGAQGKALTGFGQNLASTDYNNWLSQWYDSLKPYQVMAGMGQTSANNLGVQGSQTAQGVGNSQIQAGNAQAAGILGASQPWINVGQWGANQLMQYGYNQNVNQNRGYPQTTYNQGNQNYMDNANQPYTNYYGQQEW